MRYLVFIILAIALQPSTSEAQITREKMADELKKASEKISEYYHMALKSCRGENRDSFRSYLTNASTYYDCRLKVVQHAFEEKGAPRCNPEHNTSHYDINFKVKNITAAMWTCRRTYIERTAGAVRALEDLWEEYKKQFDDTNNPDRYDPRRDQIEDSEGIEGMLR